MNPRRLLFIPIMIVSIAMTFTMLTGVMVTKGLAAPQPWHIVYEAIDLEHFEFQHPMTVVNQEELAISRQRAALGVEPQATALQSLLRDAERAQSFEPDPPLTMDIMGGYAEGSNLSQMRAWLWRNQHAAYASALAYAYTGETGYADKAVEILNAWAHQGTTFTGADRGLQLGSWFTGMLYAADLVYDYPGWSADDRTLFQDWWRAKVLPHTREVMQRRYNNWKDAGILGVLAAAVVLEDKELLDEALVELLSYFHPRTDSQGLSPEVWKMKRHDSIASHAYLPDEVTRNDGESGITYTAYALTTAVQALEIARYAGFNFWHHQTPEGVTFRDVIESFFRWDILHEPFPWYDDPKRGRDRKNVYELANNHYDMNDTLPELAQWLATNRPVNGEQGDQYVTLNKGDIPPISHPRNPGLRPQIQHGYDGLYTAVVIDDDVHLSLLIGSDEDRSRPDEITLNLLRVDDVRLLSDGQFVPHSFVPNGVAIDLRRIRHDRSVVDLILEGAAQHVVGIVSVETVGLENHVVRGPVPLEIDVTTYPEDLALDLVQITINDRVVYQGREIPRNLVINNGELTDGLHRLAVRVVAADGVAELERETVFEVMNSAIVHPEEGESVVGHVTVQVETALPEELIQSAHVGLRRIGPEQPEIELWHGDTVPPPLVVGTRDYPDGPYRLVARMTTNKGATTEASTDIQVQNRWQLLDQLLPPVNVFGVMADRSLTTFESPGWRYETADWKAFFGDRSRKVRVENTEEELIWEAPRLRSVTVSLYTKDLAIEDIVELSVATDASGGASWRPLPYRKDVTDRSDEGWYEVKLLADFPDGNDIRYFRLGMAKSPVPVDHVQVGEVLLEGMLNDLPTSTSDTAEVTGWTQDLQFTLDAAMMNNPELWLAGLTDEDNGFSDAVYLRWVQDRSLWIPRWRVELVAREGLIPAELVDRNEASWDVVVLADPLMPGRGHTYTTKLSYSPGTRAMSFILRNDTTDTILVEGQLRLDGETELTSIDEKTLPTVYSHVEKYAVNPGYETLGTPLALVRDFSWEWVRVKEDDVINQGGFQFWDVETPGLRVHWPPSAVPGRVHFSLMADDETVGVYEAGWSEEPTIITLNNDDLHEGEYLLRVTYVDGEYDYPIGDDRLRISPTKITATYEIKNRDVEDTVWVYATLRTEADAGLVPFTLHTRYLDDAGVVLLEQRMEQAVFLEPNRPTVLEYELTVPTSSGMIHLDGETMAGVALKEHHERFVIPPAPTFRVWPVHDELPAEIGQPAMLSFDADLPRMALRATRDGLVRAETFVNGVPVDTTASWEVTANETKVVSLAHDLQEYVEKQVAQGTKLAVYEVRLQLEATESHPPAYQSLFWTLADSDVGRVVALDDDGRLLYIPDYLGNRIPDFSYAGYMGGGVPLPAVPVQVVVEPIEGDATDHIQAAIDYVAGLPLNEDGFRGAVLLRAGKYEVAESLRIETDGIVLRGEGSDEDGTVLVATGRAAYNVIEVRGPGSNREVSGSVRAIQDTYVPVGSHSFHVERTDGLDVGDIIVVRRHGNAAWIQEIGMDRIGDRPGDPESTRQWAPFSLNFERVITAIEGRRITVDAPVIQSIDAQWGGGEIVRVTDTRISQVGVENIRAVSHFDPDVVCNLAHVGDYACDEEHAGYLVRFNHVKDAWLRDVVAVHFAHGPVELASGSKRVTVQDAAGYEPVSIITGSRRYPYASNGQLNLIQRVYSQGARHAFSVGARVTGPNVFLNSVSEDDYATSEPHHRWSVGGLYDNVTSPIQIQDRQWYGTGQGWSGAFYVTWNTRGLLVVQKPPTAQNWAIGHVGSKEPGDFGPRDDGYWESLGQPVNPASLYLKQLEDRLGRDQARD